MHLKALDLISLVRLEHAINKRGVGLLVIPEREFSAKDEFSVEAPGSAEPGGHSAKPSCFFQG